jgi:hypothetical protein
MAMMPQNRIGLNTIGTNNMTQMAGGGIIAFADTGAVPPAVTPAETPVANQDVDWFTVNPNTKQKEFDIDKFMIANSKPGPSVSDAIMKDVQAQRDALAEAKQGKERDQWLSAGATMLQNTSPFWQVGLGSGLNAYSQASSEAAKDIATRQSDITKSELLAAEKDEAAKTRMVGLGIAASTARDNALTRSITSQYYNNMVLNDKETKNAAAFQDQWEKTYKTNYANEVLGDKDSVNPMTDDERKFKAYNATYNVLTKTPNGKKYSGAYLPPDQWVEALGTYAPKVNADTTKAPEPSFFEKIFGAGKAAQPAGQVDPNNKFLQ